MHFYRRSPYAINKFWLLLFLLAVSAAITSCFNNSNKNKAYLIDKLRRIDSLNFTKGDSAMRELKKLRPQLGNSDSLLASYYWRMARYHEYIGLKPMGLYADSAIGFFAVRSRADKYPDEYFKALLIKGDVELLNKKYVVALNYYYQAKNVLTVKSCDNGDLANKMGTIYFKQRNFLYAGRFWAESANKLVACNSEFTKQRLFYMEQGALNNAGVSYERGGLLDTAKYYYLKDLDFINKTEAGQIGSHDLNSARAVVYDNLGGVYSKLGNFALAEDYLHKCLAIPNANIDGTNITPLLKLADLYLKTGNNAKAAKVFVQSKALLDRYYKDNPESYIQYHFLYAQYMYRMKHPADAYLYQSKYIRLRDSVNNLSTDLFKLDVERELNTLRQKQVLTYLEQKDKVRETYLAGIGVFVVLSVIIIILIARNLKRSKRNHRETTLKNEQLQLALDELERVNKNYIRIMRVMAHDLRNPLSGMTGIAAMLLDDDEFSEDSRHMLKLIETTGAHTMEMINELLKTGLADENEQILKQTIDLQSLLFDSVELLQFRADEKQQKIVFESDGVPMMADVNHEKIWRVFNNLIVNAIKFSHAGKEIKVSIGRHKKNILIAIADSGIGIPENERDSIFEMFTAAKKFGTNGEQPFGLGLSISKKIIEKHNGKIWFDSTVGVGTTFYIELPSK